MSMNDFILSPKYRDYVNCVNGVNVEFLEGTTAAGKTTVAIYKFMLLVARSPKKLHIISGLDTGTIEKNIINKDYGILDVFGNARENETGLCEYYGQGSSKYRMPHIVFHAPSGDKVVLILGYDNEARWKKALGGQYGILYIDEINMADMNYVREAAMRCDYLIGTLNPDDPDKPIYKEYINHSRPLNRYKDDGPNELREMLNETPKKGWVWWFFGFGDNAALSEEKIKKIVSQVPYGTKTYANKILGMRTKATGVIFCNFDRKIHVKSNEYIRTHICKTLSEAYYKNLQKGKDEEEYEYWEYLSSGLDTSYSQLSKDTIVMSFTGITNKGKCYCLEEQIITNKNKNDAKSVAPSDVVKEYIKFLDKCVDKYGQCRQVFVDCADQATRMELKKAKSQTRCIYSFNNSYKKFCIQDRIQSMIAWFATNSYFVSENCQYYMHELETYSWDEKKDNTPEDANNHAIDSFCYSWIPYRGKIGIARD